MGSFTISKEVQFDAGHRVPSHGGQCRNPHGHRYRVVVNLGGQLVTTPGDPQEGMLVDFSFVKALLKEKVHDPLDHGFIVHEKDWPMLAALGEANDHLPDGTQLEHPRDWTLVNHELGEENRYGWKVIVFPYVPTAENIARWIFDQINAPIYELSPLRGDLWLVSVEVYETPTSMARYGTQQR